MAAKLGKALKTGTRVWVSGQPTARQQATRESWLRSIRRR